MKLVQLNMWWGGKLNNNITAFLKETKPDIICLQESVSFDQGDSALFLSTQQIQKELGLDYNAFAPAFSFNLMHGVASFGNCIISKAPIETYEAIYTNLSHIKNFDFNKHDYNVRNLLVCLIKVGGKTLNVLTHHGYHIPGHKNGNPESLRQMEQIVEHIDGLSGPAILTGDFNLAPHSESLEIINKHMINLSIKNRLRTTRTIFTNKVEVCDYVFVNQGVKVNNFHAADELISDHKALVLEFDI